MQTVYRFKPRSSSSNVVRLAAALVMLGFCTSVPAQSLWNNASSSTTWLTAGNWTPSGIPNTGTNAQFAANPTSGTTGIGINMNTAGGLQRVGAIEVTSARSSLNLLIGNSSTSATGVLELDGTTVNSIPNTILRNAGTGTTTLILALTQGSSSALVMGLSNNVPNGLIDCTSAITISNIITGYGFTMIGAGNLALTASNLYSGNTVISNGVLAMPDGGYINNSTLVLAGGTFQRLPQNITAVRGNAYRNPVIVSNNSIIETTTTSSRYIHFDSPFTGLPGTTLILTNTATPGVCHFRVYANSINYAGKIVLANGGGGSVIFESYVTNSGVAGTEEIFTGLISGGGLMYKNVESPATGGSLVLSNANNTYSGGTQIHAGYVGLGAANCLGSGNVTLGYDPGLLGLYAVDAARTLTNDVTVDTTIVNSTNLVIKGSQNLTLAGRLLIHTNFTQLTISNTAATTISGVITNAYTTSLGINKTGPGTLTLSGANTFKGSTIVSAGTLALTGGATLANITNLALAGGATLDISALSSTFTLAGSEAFQAVNAKGTTANLVCSGTAGMTLGASSPLGIAYSNGVPSVTVSGGALTLASGNVGTVTVANGGAGLPAGVYKLIAAGSGGSVAGNAPGSVTVGGDGIAGSTPSLVISNAELYLFVAANTSPPLAPVATTATGTNVIAFTASWNSSAGATDYHIDVSTSPTFGTFVYQDYDVGAVTSFLVTNLSPATVYYYEVRATNAFGSSGNSATITVTTLVAPYVWNATDGNWSAASSWQYANVPGNGVNVGFTGAGGNSTNDLSAPALNSLVFSNGAGAYQISGNAFVFSNGVVNSSTAPQTISAPVTLGLAETFNASAGALNFSGPITNAGDTLTFNAAVASTNSGAISGTGSLTKTGSSTLLLSGPNTFSGGITVSAGTLQLFNNAVASGPTNVALANTAGVTLGISDTETVAGITGGGSTGGTVALGANNLYVTASSGSNNYAGAVSGTGKLIKGGAGTTLSLSSASAIGSACTLRVENGTLDLDRGGGALIGIVGSGNTIELAGGTLQISSSVQANFGFAAGAFNIYSNSTVFFDRTGTSSGQSPTNSSPLNFYNNSTLSFTYSPQITSATTLFDAPGHTLFSYGTFAFGAYTVTIANPIGESGGSFGFTKTSTGILNLNAVNTYSGNTTNAQGTIAINATSTFGNGNGTLVLAGGNILNTSSRAGASIPNPVLMTADTTIYGDGTLTNSLRIFPLSGQFTTAGGTLTIRNEDSNATSTNNEFRVRFTAGGLNLTQPIVLGSASDLPATNAIAEIEFYGTNTAAPQTISGNISGSGAVFRAFSSGGITMLTGSNTYSGGTTIAAGTLFANSTTTSTGTNFVSVTGGVLGGNGVILGPVGVVSGGTLQAGLGSGDTSTLAVSNALTLAGNAIFAVNRANAQNAAEVSGLTTVTYGGTLTLTNFGAALQAGDTFNLFSAGSYSGSFASIVLPALGPNLIWVTNLSTGAMAVVATTTLTLASSENPSGYLDALTFTANVQTNGTTAGGATGQVIFSASGTPFSTNNVSGGAATSGSISSLPRGTNVINAVYSGDINYLASTNALNQVVTNHPPVAGNVSYTLYGGVNSLHVSISNLLATVTDTDGDMPSLAGFSMSTNGITLMSGGGNLNYYNPAQVNDQFTYTVSDGFGGTNSAAVNIIISTNSVSGQSAAINVMGGSAVLTFAGIPGLSYSVARSTDFSTWTVILTTNAPADGVFTFTDLSAPQPTAFYRLQYNP
jgi:fibronectin-binding autotransporter adhesin